MFTRMTLLVGLVSAIAMTGILTAGAAVVGTEDFSYADGAIANQTGGTGFDWDNVLKTHTGTTSDWDNVGGAPQVSGGALVTNNSSAKREYNGPAEGNVQSPDRGERLGAVQGNGIVYYRVDYTQNNVNDWSGMSSYDFGAERLFFGQPSGQGNFGVQQSGGGRTVSNMPVVVGQTYDLVAEVNFPGSLINLWVDPANDSAPVASQTYTLTNWSTAVRFGSGGQTTWDNLTVATNWTDLGFAPRTGLLSEESLVGYASGNLAGQSYLGSGYRPNGSWSGSNGTVTAGGGLSYGVLKTAGGMVTTNDGGDGVRGDLDSSAFDQADLRGSDGLIGGSDVEGTLFYSFLGQRTAGGNAGDSFAAVELYRGGSEVLGVGNNWGAWAYSTFGGGIGNHDLNSSDPEPGVSYEHVDNEVHLFVVRVDYHAGANDDVTIWLDPEIGAGESGQLADLVTQFSSVGDLSFDNVHFRSGNAGNTWNWDELRFGTSWDSVLPVPEPSTFALAAVGLLGLVSFGRRRKR